MTRVLLTVDEEDDEPRVIIEAGGQTMRLNVPDAQAVLGDMAVALMQVRRGEARHARRLGLRGTTMKRREPKELKYAQDGPHGRPAAEIAHRWMSAAKRRMHKQERQEGVDEIRNVRQRGRW